MPTSLGANRSALSRTQWALRALTLLGLVALVAAAFLTAFDRWSIFGELLSHFEFHMGLVALVGVLAALALRRPLLVLGYTALALWLLHPEAALRLHARDDAAAGDASRLRVVSANVLRPNERYADVWDSVLQQDPDVIGLLEISPAWREAALAAFSERFPFHTESRDTKSWNDKTWGLMLFSRVPLENVVVEPLLVNGRAQRPVIEVTVRLSETPVRLQLAHPQRPGAKWRLEGRSAQLSWLGDREVEGERILIGDLNTTATSRLFRQLIESTGLRDSRRSFGRQPTWTVQGRLPGPIAFPIPAGIGPSIAIDHALVSAGIAVTERATFVIPGSDHKGIVLEVARSGSLGPEPR